MTAWAFARAVKSQLGDLSAEAAWGRRRDAAAAAQRCCTEAPPPRPPAYFVRSGEAGPRLVGPAVIVLSVSHLHVVAETDEDLSFSKFFHRGSLAELQGGSAGEMPVSPRASRWGRGEAANATRPNEREGGTAPAGELGPLTPGPGPFPELQDRHSVTIPAAIYRLIRIDSQAVSALTTAQSLPTSRASVCAGVGFPTPVPLLPAGDRHLTPHFCLILVL